MKSLILAMCLVTPLAAQNRHPGGNCPGGNCPNGKCPMPQSLNIFNPYGNWDPSTQSVPAAPTNDSIQKPHPYIVRIAFDDSQNPGGYYYGSGSIVARDGNRAWVLTAAHIVRAPKATVTTPAGESFVGTVRQVDKDWDFAILTIADPGVMPVQPGQTPTVGATVYGGGYGQGSFRWTKGPLRNLLRPRQDLPNDVIEIGVAARDGDSGGPLLDVNGNIVGIISTTDDVSVDGTGIDRIRRQVGNTVPGWSTPLNPVAPRGTTQSMPAAPISGPLAADIPVPPSPPAQLTATQPQKSQPQGNILSGPAVVAPYKLVDITVTGDWESIQWSISPSEQADIRYSADQKTMTFVAPPGTYTIEVITANFTQRQISRARKAVVIGTASKPFVSVP